MLDLPVLDNWRGFHEKLRHLFVIIVVEFITRD